MYDLKQEMELKEDKCKPKVFNPKKEVIFCEEVKLKQIKDE